jgi:cytidylate kinase
VERIIIAIDGYSSCGKSTLAKALAARLGYAYIDSGAMYRAVTLYFQHHHIPLDDEAAIVEALENIHIEFHYNPVLQQNETWLNGEPVETAIRSLEVSNAVSPVSAIKSVRQAMAALQRKAGQNKGIVMDGRDIGTHVFPEAELKLFMTADPEVRAMRRYEELRAKGENHSLEAIRQNLSERDRIDTSRAENPLRQAADALVLDNSQLSQEQQLEWALQRVKDSRTQKD